MEICAIFPFFFAAVFIVIVFVLILCSKGDARQNLVKAWAESHNLAFTPEHDSGMDEYFPNAAWLQQGSDRYAFNICRGEWSGEEIIAFDYHYETGSGKDRHSYTFSVAAMRAPAPLQPLTIRREGLLDAVSGFFGSDEDIDFESDEFNRRFFVRSPDRKWAYDIIHPRMMEHLLNGPDLNVQFESRHVLAWTGGDFSPEQFAAGCDFLRDLLDLLPDYVIDDMRKR